MSRRESVTEYLARGGIVTRGEYRPEYGTGPKIVDGYGPRGTSRGEKAQMAKGCPRCGGELRKADWTMGNGYDVSALECEMCGDVFRACTGETLWSKAV